MTVLSLLLNLLNDDLLLLCPSYPETKAIVHICYNVSFVSDKGQASVKIFSEITASKHLNILLPYFLYDFNASSVETNRKPSETNIVSHSP